MNFSFILHSSKINFIFIQIDRYTGDLSIIKKGFNVSQTKNPRCGERGIIFNDPQFTLRQHQKIHFTDFNFCRALKASFQPFPKIKIPALAGNLLMHSAVREGFEPSVHGKAYDSLANCSFRPLRHLSSIRGGKDKNHSPICNFL